jgi:hypothetical protein
MTTTGGNAGRRTLTRPGPEFFGGVLAVVVGVIVVGSTLAGGSPSSPGPDSPRASATPTAPAMTPEPLVDPTSVVVLRTLNARLAASREVLEVETARANLRTETVRNEIRLVNRTVPVGTDIATGLSGSPSAVDIGARLAKAYGAIEARATDTLGASVRNDVAYRSGGEALIKLLGALPALQAELDALAAAPPSASPSASASLAPSASPSAAPSSPPPSASPSAAPSSAPSASGVPGSPEPSPAPDEQIRNGGFEAGVGPPWRLLVGRTSLATLVPDTATPGAGTTSARVDIAVGSEAFAGISLGQPGINLEGGRGYTVTMLIRAQAPRSVRVKVGSVDGGTYDVKDVSVSTAWAPATFTFFATQSDSSAVFSIELGRSDITTWVDLVSFRPTPALF